MCITGKLRPVIDAVMNQSLEEDARDFLTLAIKDGLVALAHGEWDNPDPQVRSTGEIVALANFLDAIDRRARAPD
jgi:hypothetical protein